MPGYPAFRAVLTLMFYGLSLNFGALEAERYVVDRIFCTGRGVVFWPPLSYFIEAAYPYNGVSLSYNPFLILILAFRFGFTINSCGAFNRKRTGGYGYEGSDQ